MTEIRIIRYSSRERKQTSGQHSPLPPHSYKSNKIMDIIPNIHERHKGSKSEQELVENEKQEYKLIGTYLRTRGLKLFAYRELADELFEVDIQIRNVIHLIPNETKTELIPNEVATEEVNINSQDIHFEALNWKTARRRLVKYKARKIKELCNLKLANPEGIKFY